MDFEALNPETVSSVSAAARGGHVEVLKVLLEKGKASNIQDNKGWRALHHASHAGHLECVNLLLKAPDVDVNAVSFDIQTALCVTCSSKQESPLVFSIAKALLEAGADPNVQIKNQFINIFNEAVCRKYLPLVELLIQYRVRINQMDFKFGNALNIVARNGSREMLKLLLRQDLVLDPKHHHSGWFYYFIISRFDQREDMLKMILKKPQCLALINYQNSSQTTPLMYACTAGCEGAIEILLNYGADPNIKNDKGILPLCEAARTLPDESASEDGVFVRLFRLTCKRYIKVIGKRPSSSLLFSVLSQGTKKKMLKFVLEEGNLPTGVTLLIRHLRSVVDPLLFSLYFEITCFVSPLAVLCGGKNVEICGRQNDKEHLEMATMLLKNLDVNEKTTERLPPLIEATAFMDGFSSFDSKRFDIIYYLLSQGAHVLHKSREDHPIPSVFLVAILQLTPVCLEFLLLHCVPAELVFTNNAFYSLSLEFKDYIALAGPKTCSEPKKYEATHIIQWLLVVSKYLPRFPPRISQFLSIYTWMNTMYTGRGHWEPRPPSEVYKEALSLLHEIMESPKKLAHLASLRVRLSLWESRKNVLISTSVHQLCQKLKLPTIVKSILMFDMDKECDREVS